MKLEARRGEDSSGRSLFELRPCQEISRRTISIRGRRSKWWKDAEKSLPGDLCFSYNHVEKIYSRTISIRARRSKWRHDVEKILPTISVRATTMLRRFIRGRSRSEREDQSGGTTWRRSFRTISVRATTMSRNFSADYLDRIEKIKVEERRGEDPSGRSLLELRPGQEDFSADDLAQSEKIKFEGRSEVGPSRRSLFELRPF
jgi:hypothetical protein